MPKARINRDRNVENGIVTFTEIASGESVTCDVTEIFPGYADFNEVQKQAILHAINAKVGDSAADPKESACDAFRRVWSQLKEGVWNARGSGDGGSRVTVLAEAIAAVKGIDLDAVVAKLADMTKEQKAELAKHPQVAAKMDEIKARRAAEKARAAKKAAADAEADELDF